MNDNEKVSLLKEHVRNERYSKEPIANALISLLVKKEIISYSESKALLREFDQYMDNQVDIFFNNLKDEYDPEEENN